VGCVLEEDRVIPLSIQDIRSFIVETFLFGDGARLSDTTPLLDSHIIDSTGVLEIVAFLEQRFGIRVEDKELVPENLNSISSIATFLDRKNSLLK
jgi:acyl carrier protein